MASDLRIDEELKQFATEQQQHYIDTINLHQSTRKAAKVLGISRSALRDSIERVQRKAAIRGHSPQHDMTKIAPEPFVVRGTSSLYDHKGDLKLQWVKTKLDEDHAREAIEEWARGLADDVRGLAPLISPPSHALRDLLTVYGIGDPHFGMFSWHAETGEADFDLPKAEQLTCGAIDRLVSVAPASETALLINIGDMFHADNNTNRTPENGNPLDVDTRYTKIMQVGFRAMVHTVQRLATKHQKVAVWILPGNHDPASSFALAMCLDAYFSANPHIQVDLSPGVYKYFHFGKNLIGAHHGHGPKALDLPLIMAADKPVEWGASTQRIWYCGHIHHKTMHEVQGVRVETFRTLAPRDAWHASKGYRAGRDMQCIIHHKEFGEIERHRCDISMLEDAALS